MTEYINKDEFKKRINDMIREGIIDKDDTKVILGDFVLKVINGFPTADVQKVQHGHWTNNKGGIVTEFECPVWCSICGQWADTQTPYCSNCGSKMDEEIKK